MPRFRQNEYEIIELEKPKKTFADLLMCLFIPFGKIDIYFEWKSYFCGLDAPIKVVCSIVSMMMVTFMAIDRLMVSIGGTTLDCIIWLLVDTH